MNSHNGNLKVENRDDSPTVKSEILKVDESFDAKIVDKIIEKFKNNPGALLGVLEELQNAHPNKYLPKPVLKYVSEKMNVSLSRIYSVVTFYSFFNLKPQGKHCITVCRGTACHTKGSRVLLDKIQEFLKLSVNPNEESEKFFLTSDDRLFTLRTVACFGQCALAPVVEIDGVIYSNVKQDQLKSIIQKIMESEKK
jgi:NADH-quinone oxidoreductase subunit E